jgi:hypothetical protein
MVLGNLVGIHRTPGNIVAVTTTHGITAITPKPATGNGDIDGFTAHCSCSNDISSSLRTLAAEWGRDHVNYVNHKPGR